MDDRARVLVVEDDRGMCAAPRALEEQESLARRLLEPPWAGRAERTRARLRQRVDDARRGVSILRELLSTPIAPEPTDDAAGAGPAAERTSRERAPREQATA